MNTTGWKCEGCGCTDMARCAGGCYWVKKDACSACVIKGALQVEAPKGGPTKYSGLKARKRRAFRNSRGR